MCSYASTFYIYDVGPYFQVIQLVCRCLLLILIHFIPIFCEHYTFCNIYGVLFLNVRFQASMTITVFWDVAPCNLVEIDRHFRGAYYSIIRTMSNPPMMEAVSTSETSVSL
jgi:hypothetical protein